MPGNTLKVDRTSSVEVEKDEVWTAVSLSAFARQILNLMGADGSSEWLWEVALAGNDHRMAVDVAKPRQTAISAPIFIAESLASSDQGAWMDGPNYATER